MIVNYRHRVGLSSQSHAANMTKQYFLKQKVQFHIKIPVNNLKIPDFFVISMTSIAGGF